jgi:hypothetical protein
VAKLRYLVVLLERLPDLPELLLPELLWLLCDELLWANPV